MLDLLLKVLWLSHRDIKNPIAGGSERNVYEVGKRLTEKGHRFVWAVVNWRRRYEIEDLREIRIRRCPSNILSHVMTPYVVKKEMPDIIVDDLGHVVPWASEILSSKPGVAVFYHLHSRALEAKGQISPMGRWILTGLEKTYPLLYRKWPFVTESESAQQDLVNLGISDNRITRIPLGVDTRLFAPRDKKETPQFLYFGGMKFYKRPWECLYAFRSVLDNYRDAQLIIVGEGPALEQTKKIAKGLSLNGSVKFIGRLQSYSKDGILRKLISESWGNFHTSVTEGFGISILEASACGTPTIGYSVPGVRDAIKHNVNGILVENSDRTKLGEAAIQLVESGGRQFSTRARRYAIQFSWDNTAVLWNKFLSSQTELIGRS